VIKKIKISRNEEYLIKFMDEYELDVFTYQKLARGINL
jgi:hypothetical protein